MNTSVNKEFHLSKKRAKTAQSNLKEGRVEATELHYKPFQDKTCGHPEPRRGWCGERAACQGPCPPATAHLDYSAAALCIQLLLSASMKY